ncbi:hypothetical protein B0H11DRAFT_1936221 [Mycena galericulata]|nr:hypothetical protein B0H11DRAFT_1936221 [Mycena galericulata]
MWADYKINGANFSAGDDVEDPEARHRQLREEAECFGLWNPEAMARKLGFGDADAAEIIEEDEEDDFLAEIFRDAGEFFSSGWEFKLWYESRQEDSLSTARATGHFPYRVALTRRRVEFAQIVTAIILGGKKKIGKEESFFLNFSINSEYKS